jgi:eukaryotic-like serine/threonine-protein kinase
MAARMANAPAPSRAQVGALFSRRWRLVRKLGEGGMGEVYAAEPIQGGQRVALKVLRPEFVGDMQVRSRFLEEGRTCMRLVHPNIVRVQECAQAEDGTPYLVMELCDGVPLGAYTQNGGRVPVAQAAPILQGILAGLTAAHAQGVIHRDLKPDNVVLARDPTGTFVVKVLDFGIAKVMDLAGGMGNRTRTGMLLGTPAYMSPEQARNARDVDQRADVWSAGVLFYEMLTGRQAFPAPTEFARLAALMSVDPEPIGRIDSALAPLGPLLERALKKDREQRFASAQEMARALAAVVPTLIGRLSGPPQPLRSDAPPAASHVGTKRAAEPRSASGSPAPMPGAPVAVSPTLAAEGVQPQRSSGSTLSSPAAPAVVEAPPQVVLLPPPSSLGETLPSKDVPISVRAQLRAARGVPRVIVTLLVVGALLVGFLLGWAFARMG